MPTQRQHKKPEVPSEALEAERVARQMYTSLTGAAAPKATPAGYIMGACKVLEMLIGQAVEQGSDKDSLKLFALQFIHQL